MKYPKDIVPVGIEVGYCPTLLKDRVFKGQIQSHFLSEVTFWL